MPATKPPTLTTLGPDDMDNNILVNRSAIRDHADLLDGHTVALADHTTRLAALEAGGGAPITGTASATIVITAAQEAQLNGLQTGAFALLQGPAADFLFKREGR